MAQENNSSDEAGGQMPLAQGLPWVSDLMASLRQFSFPSAFRIHALSSLPEAIRHRSGNDQQQDCCSQGHQT